MTPDLEEFYRSIDRDTGVLREYHEGRLRCRLGCIDCCIDGLTVLQVEAEWIRQRVRHIQGPPHPVGACAFLDGTGACRIYEHRPYVCRTQGLPLRWIAEEDQEMRDICPLNETTEPIEAIPVARCWTIGPYEGRLAGIQRIADPTMPRIPLRRLFEEITKQNSAR